MIHAERYVVLNATLGGLPAVVFVLAELFERDGSPPTAYFPPTAADARVAGWAIIQTDTADLPKILGDIPPLPA